MSFLDDLRKKLDPDTFAAVTDQLGDDFNYDVVPRSRLNKVIQQRDTYKAQVDAGTQPSAGGPEPEGGPPATQTGANPKAQPEVDVAALTAKFEQEKAQAIKDLRVEFAGLNMLREEGAFDPELSWSLIDKSKVTIGDDGKTISGLKEQIDAQKEARAFMYGSQSKRKEGEKGTGKNGGGDQDVTVTKDDFLKMSYDDQLKFKEAHPDTFKEFLESY